MISKRGHLAIRLQGGANIIDGRFKPVVIVSMFESDEPVPETVSLEQLLEMVQRGDLRLLSEVRTEGRRTYRSQERCHAEVQRMALREQRRIQPILDASERYVHKQFGDPIEADDDAG